MNLFKNATGFLFLLSFVVWMVGTWLTHIIVCIENYEWVFLIVGALFVPVGVIHGTGIWIGVY